MRRLLINVTTNHFIIYFKIILYGIISCHHNIIHSLYKLGCQCLFFTKTSSYGSMERVGLPILDDRDFVGHRGPDPQGLGRGCRDSEGPVTSMMPFLPSEDFIIATKIPYHL